MTPDEIAKARTERTYKVEWHMKLRPEGVKGEELDRLKCRGSDALFTASIAFPKDGSYSVYFDSIDGRSPSGEQLSDNEWFKIWMMLANRLSESKTLEQSRRQFVQITWETLRGALFGGPCNHAGCAHGPNHNQGHNH